MVCYKQKAFDPASQSPATLRSTTVNWSDFLQRPGTQLVGCRWPAAPPRPSGEFIFSTPSLGSPIPALSNGNAFGLYNNFTLSVVGEETDAVRMVRPSNFRRLAYVRDATDTYDTATMGLFSPANTEADPGSSSPRRR